jgi:hypothetical protein
MKQGRVHEWAGRISDEGHAGEELGFHVAGLYLKDLLQYAVLVHSQFARLMAAPVFLSLVAVARFRHHPLSLQRLSPQAPAAGGQRRCR